MTVFNQAFIDDELSKQTSIFGLKLWVVIGVFVGAAVVLILFSISLCLTSRRRSTSSKYNSQSAKYHSNSKANAHTDPVNSSKSDVKEIMQQHHHHQHHRDMAAPVPEIQIEIGGRPDHRVVFSAGSQGSAESKLGNNTNKYSSSSSGGNGPEVSHLGWGRWYTLRELEEATNGLADENVVGEGGYGIVYSGVLADNTKVAVKNLLNNR